MVTASPVTSDESAIASVVPVVLVEVACFARVLLELAVLDRMDFVQCPLNIVLTQIFATKRLQTDNLRHNVAVAIHQQRWQIAVRIATNRLQNEK
jgi:hypothetical protein